MFVLLLQHDSWANPNDSWRDVHDRQVKKLRKQAQPRSWKGDPNKTHRMSSWVTVRSRQSVLIGPVGPGNNFQSGAGSMGRAAISTIAGVMQIGKTLSFKTSPSP